MVGFVNIVFFSFCISASKMLGAFNPGCDSTFEIEKYAKCLNVSLIYRETAEERVSN